MTHSKKGPIRNEASKLRIEHLWKADSISFFSLSNDLKIAPASFCKLYWIYNRTTALISSIKLLSDMLRRIIVNSSWASRTKKRMAALAHYINIACEYPQVGKEMTIKAKSMLLFLYLATRLCTKIGASTTILQWASILDLVES
jgi:hypothetical protein